MKVSFEIKSDNTKQAIEEKDKFVLQILEKWGMTAESYAKSNLTAAGRVDTGLLRNSITYALSGEKPNIETYRGDNASKYGGEGIPSGRYDGVAPEAKKGEASVYIGTNVEYGAYVELGTDTMSPTHFLKRAISDHFDQYRDMAKEK